MNPITPNMQTGTVGELLVQIRLLQYGVQAAPPIKDSGNDLIAVNGQQFRAVSVKTTTTGRYNKPEVTRVYHVLGVVWLKGTDRELFLDGSEVFLIPQAEVTGASDRCEGLEQYRFSRELVETLFGDVREQRAPEGVSDGTTPQET